MHVCRAVHSLGRFILFDYCRNWTWMQSYIKTLYNIIMIIVLLISSFTKCVLIISELKVIVLVSCWSHKHGVRVLAYAPKNVILKGHISTRGTFCS